VIYSRLTDFHIFGNGMKITGTGDRAIEFSGALRCSVNEVNIVRDSGVFEAFGASFDVASTEVAFRRVSVDGGAGVAATPTSVGLAMEAVVDGVIDDCVVTHIGASGAACAIYLPSTRAVTVSDTRIRKSYRGISLCQSGTGDTESSRDTHIRACDIEDTTTEGVIASGGVVGLQITDTVVRRATTYGMYLGADPDGSPLGVTMTDCETSDCGSYGLGLAAGVGIFVTAHRSNNNTSGALYLRASAIVRGMQAAAKGMIVTDTGSWTALLSGLDMTVPAGQNALTGNATCDLTVTDSVFRLNATANWCDWQAGAGTLRASNVRTTGGNIRILEITEELVVRLEFVGNCVNCPMSTMTFRAGVEEAIRKSVPEVRSIEVVNLATVS
jgi:Fe-S cluster biogenesis protein NfuA